jgi:hypothetical protein
MYPQADDPLVEQVWQVMSWHVGYVHRIDRGELTKIVFGKVTKTYDRKVRDALSELPVVWDDGYFVPRDQREAQGYVSAMRSRQAAIGKRLRVLDEYLTREREPVKVKQMRLVEV